MRSLSFSSPGRRSRQVAGTVAVVAVLCAAALAPSPAATATPLTTAGSGPRIVGSIRPQRRGPAIADWIPGIGRDSLSGARREPIDLRDCPLPRDDEPGIRRRRIAGTDGVLFVT